VKRLLLASAVLGLAGIVSTANADTVLPSVPIDATSLTIWTGDTPGQTILSANQQALPFASALFATGPSAPGLPLLGTLTPSAPAPINFSYGTTTPGVQGTIPGFLGTATNADGSTNLLWGNACTGACATNTN